jgi:hypothetical protein
MALVSQSMIHSVMLNKILRICNAEWLKQARASLYSTKKGLSFDCLFAWLQHLAFPA